VRVTAKNNHSVHTHHREHHKESQTKHPTRSINIIHSNYWRITHRIIKQQQRIPMPPPRTRSPKHRIRSPRPRRHRSVLRPTQTLHRSRYLQHGNGTLRPGLPFRTHTRHHQPVLATLQHRSRKIMSRRFTPRIEGGSLGSGGWWEGRSIFG